MGLMLMVRGNKFLFCFVCGSCWQHSCISGLLVFSSCTVRGGKIQTLINQFSPLANTCAIRKSNPIFFLKLGKTTHSVSLTSPSKLDTHPLKQFLLCPRDKNSWPS
ncbi:hypothetical protein BKA65DRAFT_236773 [Rhexocercosporidium sp. MPI-PUGE-AT-0058]|nr:hypothetical protein BKA65DRAFT_236773 [Rhexocercosporidium sp. MPI-PUGE-AT-0058]